LTVHASLPCSFFITISAKPLLFLRTWILWDFRPQM
jgi:hypothetical protein